MKRQFTWILPVMAFFLTVLGLFHAKSHAAGNKIKILATTFPIFQITRNVVQGHEAVEVALMLPSQLGCPHDYALSPQDIQKLLTADVMVVNGLGMEEFLGTPLKNANPALKIIDTSDGIKDVLKYASQNEESGYHDPEKEDHRHVKPEGAAEDARHHHAGSNPHLYTSPRRVSLLAMKIAEGLSMIDPAGRDLYSKNAKSYSETMNALAYEFTELGGRLKNNRIVTQHGVFDYLAEDMGLTIVAVMQPHAGQEPSAAEMLEIVKNIREKNAGAIFTEPQYPDKIGRTIAGETGIPSAVLDPAATGPDNAPLDYYERVMRKNLETLKKTLGIR